MAAFADQYTSVAAMQAVVPTNDGQLATVIQGGKATLYSYLTQATITAAVAASPQSWIAQAKPGWYKVSNP